ncbi:MAG: hypothetical protein AVO39_03490 [delta proteobacterium MLS_D]|jgi:branched-chain amino acid transport system substrate-binding protein|nr:MAG: hypothetical protein AVO39_03490 [delta proteobacterium MLS_D]
MRVVKSLLVIIAALACIGWPVAGAAEEVVIGYTGPLSGPAAEYAKDNFTGADLAIREINADGGITVAGKKYTFRFECLDDQMSPEAAVANARKLVSRYNAPVVFNSLAHCIGPLLKVNVEPGNEFLIMGYSSIHSLHNFGNPLFINPTPNFIAYIIAYCDIVWQKGFRRGAMVVVNTAYGDSWRGQFRSHWERRGGIITADHAVPYSGNPDDYRKELEDAIAADPDFILIGGASVPTALVAKLARELGYDGAFLLSDQARMDAMARFLDHREIRYHNGTDVLNSVIGVANIADLPLPYSTTFAEKYTSIFKRPPAWETALNYTAMKIIARAMVKAGTVSDPFAIRAAIPELLENQPILGDKSPNEVFGIEDNGILKSAGVLQTVEDGRTSRVDHIFSFPKSEEEFYEALNLSKAIEPENIRWFPLR